MRCTALLRDVARVPARMRLPGDELLPRGASTATHAVDVPAPPERVWPWLVQMGVGRGGWYAIDLLDNLGRRSTRTIEPRWQGTAVGDVLPATPGGDVGFEVVDLDAPRHLVLTIGSRSGWLCCSWALVLLPTTSGTRLHSRLRLHVGPRWLRPLARLVVGAPHGLMQRTQLVNIRDRATT